MTSRENQILRMGQQHAADMQEIERLRETLERLEADNEALRDWVKLNITLQSVVLKPTTIDSDVEELPYRTQGAV